ncbi:hypothetical protein M441DRAFT_336644 [Trichoderma asperellum CBS 433.97]|uniref:Uncharacterized protein n=1 Tax=Trichoderma asperellum (strain ATCC 204424 / CBS 433.97 / NBRC 101777) TaxID=1042311 RepID=A0A2T3ZGC1_TRIA4|nr:hypothetical protein M441DRAFT_336644 [Trichoderma asperellum CBS 433.97]PTB43854.1 hypothetical protein M441DRAFT_336644 [Trichoderma asperellum CBS 433.97]
MNYMLSPAACPSARRNHTRTNTLRSTASLAAAGCSQIGTGQDLVPSSGKKEHAQRAKAGLFWRQGSRRSPTCTYHKLRSSSLRPIGFWSGLVALWRLAQRNWGPDWRVWSTGIAKNSSPYGAHHQSSYILDMGPVASPSGVSISIQAPRTSCVIVCYRLFLAEDALSVRFFSPSYRLFQSTAGLDTVH